MLGPEQYSSGGKFPLDYPPALSTCPSREPLNPLGRLSLSLHHPGLHGHRHRHLGQ
jgi:hypothetical protein